jgi:transposase
VSMRPKPIGPVPEDTARVARAAFPKGTTYVQMRDVLGAIYDDEDFSELFEVRGRPAIAPWRLALVTLMQFSEGLSDRQTAEAVRARIDWKYALSLRLSDPGFHFSVLSEFRSRLLEGGKQRGYFWRSSLRGVRSAVTSRCAPERAPIRRMYGALCVF